MRMYKNLKLSEIKKKILLLLLKGFKIHTIEKVINKNTYRPPKNSGIKQIAWMNSGYLILIASPWSYETVEHFEAIESLI